jgi:hypothetical protein
MWHHVSPNSRSKGKRERQRGLNGNDHLPHGETEEWIRGGLPSPQRRSPVPPGMTAAGERGETESEMRGIYSPQLIRRGAGRCLLAAGRERR